MTFPQIARLELDELLEQLVERAQDVLGTQGRLRGLLAATRAISADLSLPVLLRRITEAAVELVGARYGALGVIGPDGRLSEFLTVGVDPSTADQIGALPRGAGILGLLISDPRPLRLTDLTAHPAAVGLPADHPPMGSFLGVPIRVRDRVFGNLYLTEKLPTDRAGLGSGGGGRGAGWAEFTGEDEELLVALASAAGVAIDNARLYAAAQHRQVWLQASQEIVTELLAEHGDALPLITTRARRTADADLAAILVPAPDDPDSLLVVAADGAGAEALRGTRVARSGSLAGQALAEQSDLLLADADAEVEAARLLHHAYGLSIGPAVLVRVRGADHGDPGILALTRSRGTRPFDTDDRDMITGFAGHAGLALELAHAQQNRQELLVADDRDRIARDLHDQVIQQLFGMGLAMSALAARTHEPAVADRLGRFTDDLDTTIRTIRQTIFQLHQHSNTAGLRRPVMDLVRELTPALGFAPTLRLDGPMDTVTSPELTGHVTAVLREALTNTARHAHARTVQVSLEATGDRLELTVTDDGVGLPAPGGRRSGLANMTDRATQLGGTCTHTAAPDPAAPDPARADPAAAPGRAGTRICWSVPLPATTPGSVP